MQRLHGQESPAVPPSSPAASNPAAALTRRAVAAAGLPPHRHLDLSSVDSPPALAAALPAVEGQPGGGAGGGGGRVHSVKRHLALPQKVVGCRGGERRAVGGCEMVQGRRAWGGVGGSGLAGAAAGCMLNWRAAACPCPHLTPDPNRTRVGRCRGGGLQQGSGMSSGGSASVGRQTAEPAACMSAEEQRQQRHAASWQTGSPASASSTSAGPNAMVSFQ